MDKIQVIDDRIPHDILKDAILAAETSSQFRVLHGGGDGSYGYKYNWLFMEKDKPETFVSKEIKALWEIVKQFVPANAILRRGYINAHSFGVEDNIHTDDTCFENGLTIIVYLCNSWYAAWNGHTLFFKNQEQLDNEIIKAITPKYNRIAIFDKNIPHCASPLSHRFSGIRLTCMFKLEVPNEPA